MVGTLVLFAGGCIALNIMNTETQQTQAAERAGPLQQKIKEGLLNVQTLCQKEVEKRSYIDYKWTTWSGKFKHVGWINEEQGILYLGGDLEIIKELCQSGE